MGGSDEPFRFDYDVKVDGCCNRDIVKPTDDAEIQQIVLHLDDIDEAFCLDGDVRVVKQVDVWRMNGPDESVCLNHDVEIYGHRDRDVVGPADAAEVQQMVLDVDGKSATWGLRCPSHG